MATKKKVKRGRTWIWGSKALGYSIKPGRGGDLPSGWTAEAWHRNTYVVSYFDTRQEAVAFCKRFRVARGHAGIKPAKERYSKGYLKPTTARAARKMGIK